MFDWLRSKIKRAETARSAPLDLATALQLSSQLTDQERAMALAEFAHGNRQREEKHFARTLF